MAFLCPRLTFSSVKWVIPRGRVILFVVLQEQMLAGWCSDSPGLCVGQGLMMNSQS